MSQSIKDSGARMTFSTGAQRDLQSGKGRFDLVPADILLYITEHRPETLNTVLFGIWAVARVYEEGAKKYDAHNWRKGIPIKCYYNSAWRHYLKHVNGHDDEPHLAQYCWNLICMLWTERAIVAGTLPDTLRVDVLTSYVPLVERVVNKNEKIPTTIGECLTYSSQCLLKYWSSGKELHLINAIIAGLYAIELEENNNGS